MAIADKLTQIAENELRVYNSGKVKGYEAGKEIGKEEGIEEGKLAERDAFWEEFQQGGNRTNYTYAFYGSSWTDENYNPKYPLKITSGNQAFQTSSITDTKVPIDITNIGTNGQIFIWANKLVTIRKLIVAEDKTINSQMFNACSELQNITIEGVIGKDFDIHWSTKLSRSSIESIIFHLSITKTGTVTLSKAAVNKAFEESEGANDGSTTNEWYTLLENYEDNWEFLLV